MEVSRSHVHIWTWPIIIILSALAVNLVILEDVQSAIRPLLVMWFLLICPGMAFTRYLRLKPMAIEVSLAIALSLILTTIVTGTLLYAGVWSTLASMLVLGILSVVGALGQLILVRDHEDGDCAS